MMHYPQVRYIQQHTGIIYMYIFVHCTYMAAHSKIYLHWLHALVSDWLHALVSEVTVEYILYKHSDIVYMYICTCTWDCEAPHELIVILDGC